MNLNNNDGWEDVPSDDGWETVESTPSDTSKTILDRLTSKETRPIGLFGGAGVLMSASGKREEDILPGATSVIGAFLGSRLGHPNQGAGIGQTTGELGRQAISKYMRGSGEDIDPAKAIIEGGAVAIGSKALSAGLGMAGVSTKLAFEKSRGALLDNVLKAVNMGHKQLTVNWENSVNQLVAKNPNVRISLQEPIRLAKEHISGLDKTILPQIKTAVKNNPKLAKAFSDPSKAINLTLQEAQELKNVISSTTKSIIRRGAKGDTTPLEKGVFELLEQFDDKIVDQFPAMKSVQSAYRLGKESFKLVRPLVEKGSPAEASVLGGKFMQSTQGSLAFKQLTGLTPESARIGQAAQYAHSLGKLSNYVRWGGGIVLGGAIAKKALGRESSG